MLYVQCSWYIVIFYKKKIYLYLDVDNVLRLKTLTGKQFTVPR